MAAPVARQRGSIRRRARCWEIRVSAGEDPSTGERIVLVDSVQIEGVGERAERAAYKEAEKVRTRLLADADELKVARTKATVGALLERFMAQHEIDETTRMNYASQIRLYIEPKLGDVPLVLFVREAAQRLEPWYAQLRRCAALCNGRSFIEKHAEEGPHDCAAAGCKRHICKPYAASSVRSLHAILSGACSAAVRWGWISFNPMPSVRPPAKLRPQPRPPTAEQMARIVEAAWAASPEWGLYVWLSAVLGARRGEVVALQWEDIDLSAGVVRLDENYVRASDGMILKDTKSHQMRRIASGPVPAGAGWAFEVKFDGVRAIGYATGSGLRLFSRNDNDVTASYREVAAFEVEEGLVLDGELVALDGRGRPISGCCSTAWGWPARRRRWWSGCRCSTWCSTCSAVVGGR